MLDASAIEQNVKTIQQQIESFFARVPRQSSGGSMILVNNADWWTKISSLSMLRDIGKLMKMSTMLQKDSVSQRLSQEQSMSFTEFSYQLLQAFDFVYLHRHLQVQMQIGGSDQWGNITAGIDLAHRYVSSSMQKRGKSSNSSSQQDALLAITMPLMTTSQGEKFGKSAGNALYLDAKMTTPLQMYQYLLNQTDQDVERLLLRLTFGSLEEIEEIMVQHRQRPESRFAQKYLAKSLLTLLHDSKSFDEAHHLSQVLFGEQSIRQWMSQFSSDHQRHWLNRLIESVAHRQDTELIGKTILDVLVPFRPCKSTAELRQLFAQRAVHLNETPVAIDHIISEQDLLLQHGVIINIGKRFFAVHR